LHIPSLLRMTQGDSCAYFLTLARSSKAFPPDMADFVWPGFLPVIIG